MEIVRKRTSELRKIITDQVKPGNNIEKRTIEILSILKDLYKNRNGVILTCGPSLTQYLKQVQWFMENEFIVICVKQALQKTEMTCDFQTLNFCNEVRYQYKKDHVPVRLYCQSNLLKQLGKGGRNSYDMYVSHYNNNMKDNILTGIMNDKDEMGIQNWTKRKRFAVKWGDTMCELTLPLCAHLGLQNVFIVGWDCTNFSQHFYNPGKATPPPPPPKKGKRKRPVPRRRQNRSRPRQKLDQLMVQASEKIHSFCIKYYNMSVKLVGNHSALKLPTISIEDIRQLHPKIPIAPSPPPPRKIKRFVPPKSQPRPKPKPKLKRKESPKTIQKQKSPQPKHTQKRRPQEAPQPKQQSKPKPPQKKEK